VGEVTNLVRKQQRIGQQRQPDQQKMLLRDEQRQEQRRKMQAQGFEQVFGQSNGHD
jgi:hypothetical protein